MATLGKKIAVLGFGLEGKAVIDHLSRHGIKPVLFDQKERMAFSSAELKFISQKTNKAVFGKDAFRKIAGFDQIFKSPGIAPSRLPKNLKVTSQTAEFLDRYAAQTIGVTGTKGKGTTSTLIYEMLKKDGRPARLTGNIGKEQAFELYGSLGSKTWVVFELSSFQLRDIKKSPHVSVVLMTTSEHMDWHKDRKDYLSSKAGITKFQTERDFSVICADYPGSKEVGKFGQGQKSFFSRRTVLKNGTYVKNGKIVRSVAGQTREILPVSQIALLGRHNWENACAAAETALLLGCSLASVRQVLKTFSGLPHRLELAGEVDHIKFYNDSFSTIPETTVAAIEAFGNPTVLILGGSGKKSDFRPLAKKIAQTPTVRKVLLLGSEANRISKFLSQAGVAAEKVFFSRGSFRKAVSAAYGFAQKGDTVLLSPACASFDMFKNYKDRGDQFKKIILGLNGKKKR